MSLLLTSNFERPEVLFLSKNFIVPHILDVLAVPGRRKIYKAEWQRRNL
jgi:hypothetical protein